MERQDNEGQRMTFADAMNQHLAQTTIADDLRNYANNIRDEMFTPDLFLRNEMDQELRNELQRGTVVPQGEYQHGHENIQWRGSPTGTNTLLTPLEDTAPRYIPIAKKRYYTIGNEHENDAQHINDTGVQQTTMGPTTPNRQIARPRLNVIAKADINPYISLSNNILDAIAQERDTRISGSHEERAQQLHELDNIMPDWIEAIRSKTLDNFQILTGTQLYVFGSLYGVSFDDLGRVINRDLVNYIRISILIKYPLHHGRECLPVLIRQIGRPVLEILVRGLGIERDHVRFINTEDLRTAVTTQKTNHIMLETIKGMAIRYRTITQHKYVRLIRKLYDNLFDRNDEAGWIGVVQLPPHPLESIILHLDSYDPSDIIDRFQMKVPLAYSNNRSAYVKNNIIEYADVLTRGNLKPISVSELVCMSQRDVRLYLNKLTDAEIFNVAELYVAYESRVSLVVNVTAALTSATNTFFYPTIRSYERSQNRETVSFSDITEANVFMVAYGKATRYSMYEMEDFMGAFHRGENGGLISFSNPLNTAHKFTITEIEELRRLLTCFEATPEITQVIAQIDDGLIDEREKTEYDEAALRKLITLDKVQKELIQQFLRQIFYVGMYMRRWEGPGHPFPLRRNNTLRRVEEDQLDAIVKAQIEPAVALLDSMTKEASKYCLGLKMCEYQNDGSINTLRDKLETEWHLIGNGKQCIRMASSKLVGTGYHYLRVLFRETIPGVDVTIIDRVQ